MAPNRVYRNGFAYVIVLGVSLRYPAVRLAIHKGEALGRGVVLGGASVLLLSLLLLDFPYRLIASADAREFPAVQWDKANCFIIGEKQIDLLLFCPVAKPPPRNQSGPQERSQSQGDRIVPSIFSPTSKAFTRAFPASNRLRHSAQDANMKTLRNRRRFFSSVSYLLLSAPAQAWLAWLDYPSGFLGPLCLAPFRPAVPTLPVGV